MRVIEWLRLFDKTAFFIRLIDMTLDYIEYFMIIMILCYLMFYTAIVILDLNSEGIELNDAYMIRFFGVFSMDAFVSES